VKIEVTRFITRIDQVDSHAYDDDLPWPCIIGLSVETHGEDEWSAYCCFTDHKTVVVQRADAMTDYDLYQHGYTRCEALHLDADAVFCIEPNGTEWTVEELLVGLTFLAKEESK
jgi:hypothetical protein